MPGLRRRAGEPSPDFFVGGVDVAGCDDFAENWLAIVAGRAAALKVHGYGKEAVCAVGWELSNELVSVAVRIPFVGVGVGEEGASDGVFVVEYRVGHAAVHQEAFDFLALVLTVGVSDLAVD